MANIDKSSLSYQTLAQLKAQGGKATAGEIVSALREANPEKEIAPASIGSFLNKFDVYKVAKKTKDGTRSLYEYASKAAQGDVDAAYAAYLDNVKKGVRKTPKQVRGKRSAKAVTERQGMTEAQEAAVTKKRPKQARRKRTAKAVAESQSMSEAQQIAAAVTKEIMAAVDKIMVEKMAEIEERMDKFTEVMKTLIIKQHSLTEAELALLKS
jgi:pyruvate/2-oxoglutarate dehydrogenase complex dihydrolipoamide acyltransferase (E2) component